MRWTFSTLYGTASAGTAGSADFTRLHSRRYGKLCGYHVLPELAVPVGPDSVSVQLRTDDAELPHSYYSGYPLERWSGPSRS